MTGSGGTDIAPEPPPAIDPVKVVCEAFAPIFWSRRDTDETIAAVKAHNAAWVAICPAREE